MSCFARFSDINAVSNKSVLPFAVDMRVLIIISVNKVKLFLDIFEHRAKSVFLGAAERF